MMRRTAPLRAAAASALRSSSSNRPTRSSLSHSPAVYDSPSPTLPRVASRRKSGVSWISSETGRPLRSGDSFHPAASPRACRTGVARARVRAPRLRPGRAPTRARCGACRRLRSTVLTHAPSLVPGRTAACGGTARVSATVAGPVGGSAPSPATASADSGRATGRASRSSARGDGRAGLPSAAVACFSRTWMRAQTVVARLRERHS